MTDGLHIAIEGRVMILTMDRPKANAINSGLSIGRSAASPICGR